MGVKEGNPQGEQTFPIPATLSVDRRHIHEWGARVQRAELGEYVRPEGGVYALEDGGGSKGGFNLPPRVPLPHFSSQSRDRERPLSRGGWGQRGQEGRSGGGAPPPPPPPPPPSGELSDNDSEGSNEGEHNQSSRNSGRRVGDREELPTGASEAPPARYDPDQPWYYDPRQVWHRKAAPRNPNEGQNTWDIRSRASQVTTIRHGKRGSSTWKGCLGSKFGPINEADEARRRLAWMKQMPEESFANFFIRFNKYAPLTGFNDEALITYLKKGVAPWLPLQVVTGREEPRSYDEWTQVFTKLDRAVLELTSGPPIQNQLGQGGSKADPTGKRDNRGLQQLGAMRKNMTTKIEGKRKTAAIAETEENGPKWSFGQELLTPGGNGLPKKERRSGEDEDRSSVCVVDKRSTGPRTALTQNHWNGQWRIKEAQRELPRPIQLEEEG
ncbi:hypothetical protein F5879DRAFT_994986 [Lentinula edodes]|nr:hypothetical protein F5879DRAFT_994986 [Lentinula edodes]